MYLNRHRSQIEEECRGRNLFIPISLGGMGLERVDKFQHHVTVAQRVLAKRCYDELPFSVSSLLPLEERHVVGTLPVAPDLLSAPWLAGISVTLPDLHPGDEVVDRRYRMMQNIRRVCARRGAATFEGRMLGDRLLYLPLRLSPTQRDGSNYQHRPPRPNPFAWKTRRDFILAGLEDNCSV